MRAIFHQGLSILRAVFHHRLGKGEEGTVF